MNLKTKLIFALLLSYYTAVFSQWKPTNGLFSGEVHSIIISSNEIIVGTNKIYKSSDNGKTWFLNNYGITGSVTVIRSLVKTGVTLVAGTDDGVFTSSDNGNNWMQSAGTTGLSVYCIIVKGVNLFLSTSYNGIYKSTNNGSTWSAVNTGITTPFVDMRSLAVKGNDLYAATDGYGIFKSTNDGFNWTTVNTGLPGSYYSVSSLAVIGNNIIAGTYGAGVYKSTNDGGNWSAINNGISSADNVLGMGINGTSVYASTLTGILFKTTDYINWNSVSVGTFTATRFEAFYSTGSMFYIGSWGPASYVSPEKSYGVFSTADDGATWKHTGITDYPVSVLEVSGSNILAGTNDVSGSSARISLFKTTESDSAWSYNMGGFSGRDITALKANGSIVYLFDDEGPTGNSQIYRSTNNGNNWTGIAAGNGIIAFAAAGSLIYTGYNSLFSSDYVHMSPDNGVTWNAVKNGIPSSVNTVYGLVIKDTLLFLATNDGIYKNTVGFNAWTAVNTGLTNMIIKSLYVSGAAIYAGTQGGGIFKSVNNGGLWTAVNTGLPLFINITCFASSGGNVFAGTGNGVFATANAGASWSNVDTGLIDTSITAMAASANYLWVGTSSQGVWRRNITQIIGNVPATPGAISGSTSVCYGSSNTYSVAPVSGAANYTWTLPGGWVGTSTTNTIVATAGTSGIISITANNSSGSSAAQTLTVTVTTVNTSVSQSGNTFTANTTGAAYQWMDCSSNTPIPGATSQSYTATANGSYAVIVTQNSCSDTSLCYNINTSCQISITGVDLPYSGLTVLLANDTLTAVSLGTPSAASQSWNYSMLMNHYPKFADYKSTSAAPYAPAFPASNIYTYGPSALFGTLYGGAPVVTDTTKGYIFWKSDTTGLWMTGFRGDGGPYANNNIHTTPVELLIGAPASHGSVFNNSARWELPMNLNAADMDTFYVRTTDKVITADACGSLTTPYAVYPNILRQHEYLIRVDSVYIKSGSTVVASLEYKRDTLNNYLYLSNGIGYPVCIVHADKYNNIKDVEYYSGVIGGTGNNPDADIQLLLYPNPSNGKITVEIPKDNKNVENTVFIYNSVGSLVSEKSMPDAVLDINLCNLPRGIYFIKVYANEKNYTRKIMIQ